MRHVTITIGILALAGCGRQGGGSATGTLPPVTMISPDTANHTAAIFSPDWSHLYWWQSIGSARQLYMADTAFKSVVALPPVTVLGNVEPVWSADGKQIAAPAADTGTSVSTIMVMGADGSNARHLALPQSLTVPVDWFAGGDSLDYIAVSGGSISSFVASTATGGSRPLDPGVKGAFQAVRSPDGSHLAYLVIDQGKNTIWVADSTGRNARQLTTDGFESFAPNGTPWSPDGKQIAYESTRTGTSDVWVVSADGGQLRQLTRDVRNDSWPVWSPDGKWIAFLSDRGKQTDIWVVSDTGGTPIRVTNDAMAEQPMQWRSGTLQFAYLTGQGSSGIWRRSLGDSADQRLTPDSIRTGPPVLSPDGSQIAVRVDHGGGLSDIAVMPAAGGAMRTIVSGGSDSSMSWSPDGTRLAFISDRGGTPDVWMVTVADGKLTQLDNWPETESTPAWSSDGTAIYFLSSHASRLSDIWRVSAGGGEPTRVTTNGAMGSFLTRRGVPGLYAEVIEPNGQIATVRVEPNGKLVPVWNRGNSFPVEIMPKGDSVIIAEIRPGGHFGFRLVAATGGGEGRELLGNDETFVSLSDDGATIAYRLPNGATHDLGLLHRADGTTRRLTNTPEDENSAVLTPDGKAVLFQRSRTIRRVAVADMTRLLGK